MKLKLILIFVTCGFAFGYSQNEKSLLFEAYIDSYYSVFSGNSSSTLRRFTTTSARDRNISLNNAQFGFSYAEKNVRSNLTIHYGDIAKATWSPDFNFVQEANVGVQLFTDWWLDLGLFRTHIGTESFLPKNNDLTSTSIITYNEPFYQAGAKMAYEGSDKFDLELWIVNGYNQFKDTNKAKSLGLLFTYHINNQTSISYTNLFGDESLEGKIFFGDRFRTYHNLYASSTVKDKVKLTAGMDFSTQNKTEATDDPKAFFAFLTTVRFILTEKSSATFRYEYFDDPSGFIGGYYEGDFFPSRGFNIQGFTGGYEFKPSAASFIRIESRRLNSLSEEILPFSDNTSVSRWEFIINLGTTFEKSLK